MLFDHHTITLYLFDRTEQHHLSRNSNIITIYRLRASDRLYMNNNARPTQPFIPSGVDKWTQ